MLIAQILLTPAMIKEFEIGFFIIMIIEVILCIGLLIDTFISKKRKKGTGFVFSPDCIDIMILTKLIHLNLDS